MKYTHSFSTLCECCVTIKGKKTVYWNIERAQCYTNEIFVRVTKAYASTSEEKNNIKLWREIVSICGLRCKLNPNWKSIVTLSFWEDKCLYICLIFVPWSVGNIDIYLKCTLVNSHVDDNTINSIFRQNVIAFCPCI